MVWRREPLMVMLIKKEGAQLQEEAPAVRLDHPPATPSPLGPSPPEPQKSIYFCFLPPPAPGSPFSHLPTLAPLPTGTEAMQVPPRNMGCTFGPVFSMKPCLR